MKAVRVGPPGKQAFVQVQLLPEMQKNQGLARTVTLTRLQSLVLRNIHLVDTEEEVVSMAIDNLIRLHLIHNNRVRELGRDGWRPARTELGDLIAGALS